MRHTIDERDARRLLGGGPVALITTAWHGAQNVMPEAFATPLSIDPPLIGIAVHPARHTHDMIKYSEEFALSIPTRELLHHVQYLGSLHGDRVDKIEATQMETFAPATGAASSSRVTITTVFSGLSFTLMPRFVA